VVVEEWGAHGVTDCHT